MGLKSDQVTRYWRLFRRHLRRNVHLAVTEHWFAMVSTTAVFVVAVVILWRLYGIQEVASFARDQWVLLSATAFVVGAGTVLRTQMQMYYELEERVHLPPKVKENLFRELFRLYSDLDWFRTEVGMSAVGQERDQGALDRLAATWRSQYKARVKPLSDFATTYKLGELELELRPSDRYFKSELLHRTLSEEFNHFSSEVAAAMQRAGAFFRDSSAALGHPLATGEPKPADKPLQPTSGAATADDVAQV